MALRLIIVGWRTGWGLRWGSRKDRRAAVGAGYGPLVPVEFLTDEQAEAYGKFAEEPTRPELERFFFLNDVDRDLVALRRSTHHQLGFALQMCAVRYIGRFLPDDPLDAAWPVIEHLAGQLGIENASVVKRYTERLKTAYEHVWEIREAGTTEPAADADHRHGVRPRAGAGGRDRRLPARAAEPKRTAMLTAAMRHLEAKAIDEVLDRFQVLMATRLLNTATRCPRPGR